MIFTLDMSFIVHVVHKHRAVRKVMMTSDDPGECEADCHGEGGRDRRQGSQVVQLHPPMRIVPSRSV